MKNEIRGIIKQAFVDYLNNTHTSWEPHTDEATDKIYQLFEREIERIHDKYHWDSGGIRWSD